MDDSLLNEHEMRRIRAGGKVLRLDCAKKLAFDTFMDIGLDPPSCRSTLGAIFVDQLNCLMYIEKYWRHHLKPSVFGQAAIDLTNLSVLPSTYPENVCTSCVSAMVKYLQGVQFVLWIKLPIYFRMVSSDYSVGEVEAVD